MGCIFGSRTGIYKIVSKCVSCLHFTGLYCVLLSLEIIRSPGPSRPSLPAQSQLTAEPGPKAIPFGRRPQPVSREPNVEASGSKSYITMQLCVAGMNRMVTVFQVIAAVKISGCYRLCKQDAKTSAINKHREEQQTHRSSCVIFMPLLKR